MYTFHIADNLAYVSGAARYGCNTRVEQEEQQRAGLNWAGGSAFLQTNRAQRRRTQWTWSVRDVPSAPPSPTPFDPSTPPSSMSLPFIPTYMNTGIPVNVGQSWSLIWTAYLCVQETEVRARVYKYDRKKCVFTCTLPAEWNTRRQPSTVTTAHKWTHNCVRDYLSPCMRSHMHI